VSAWLRAALALALIALATATGMGSVLTPPVVAASAPPGEFSAERALAALAPLVAQPHPTGTPAAAEVRERIEARLRELGFEVEVQDATSVTARYASFGNRTVAGRVRNVVARRRGYVAGGRSAVAISAHYDTRPLAPGASDDGFGVAVVLEAARAIASEPPWKHDVLLVVTEGEEGGLLGAKALVEEDPAAGDVAVVLNVDSRGDRGPGVMFQTSRRASDLVETLGRGAAHVSAASLSQEIYRRMPNDTDLTEWLAAGHAGLNFASIDGFERYHQATDTIDNLDPGTVQQLGECVLAAARGLADRDDVLVPSDHDDVYFGVGPWFVWYDARAALPLGILAAAAWLAGTVVGVRRRRLQTRGMAIGLAASAIVQAIACGAARGALWLASRANPAITAQTIRAVVRKECLAASLLLGAGIAWSLYAALARRVAPASLVAGGALP
jgi:hypothetical protein